MSPYVLILTIVQYIHRFALILCVGSYKICLSDFITGSVHPVTITWP